VIDMATSAVAYGKIEMAQREGVPEPPRRSVGRGLGHFFGAMRVDAFREGAEFKAQVDDFVRTLRSTRPAPGTKGPQIPGDPEREAEKERARDGIPLLPAVIEDLRDVSRRTGVTFE
jgi:L-2-hydroxycarboxylate dehydrogenase (NAD+)